MNLGGFIPPIATPMRNGTNLKARVITRFTDSKMNAVKNVGGCAGLMKASVT